MPYKLICFDLDGTLIDETIFVWQTIHDALKTDKEARKKAMDDFYSGRISYSEWARHDIRIWKREGANKKILLNAIKPLKLMKGAMETLRTLKKRKLKLAIVSGSIDIALKSVLPNYKEFFDDVYINKIIFEKNGKIKKIIPTKYDIEHKGLALKEIAKKEKIKLKECVFIGDHHNDVNIAKIAGLSLAFNCKSDKLAQISDVLIKKKDLREILKYI